MRFKLDENMPLDVRRELAALGHDVDTVSDEGLASEPDDVVYRVATEDARVVLTQDVGFVHAANAARGRGTVVLFRLLDPNRVNLAKKARELFGEGGFSLQPNTIVVVTDHKVRSRVIDAL